MNSKNTWIWFVIAAALFAFIFVFQHFLRPPIAESSRILPGLRPNTVTSVQVIPANALAICADRTNGEWLLTKPVVYPAQPAAVETLLDSLQKLAPAIRISAAELREHRNADAEFGFEPPQISLVVEAGSQHWQLQVGNKTSPGDQVFLRVVGIDGAFVADADWLKFIPHSANDWRDTALVNFNGSTPDWIILTNGTKVIELHCDATNHLWRMTRPLLARADNSRIIEALQRLQIARLSQFISDDLRADLSAFGLQPADIDLWLGYGTNFTTAIHIGKSPTNDTSQVYAKREGWNAIATTAKEPLSPWRGTVNDFRDPYLLELSAPIAEIEMRGRNNFTLQRQGTNDWRVVGEKFPVDAGSVQQFIKILAGLRVAEFVKDVVTAPDLPAYGLATPTCQITLLSAAGDTNAVIAQLLFGATQDKEVFVRRADEDFVYDVTLEDFNRLPEAGWEFRERRIWNFTENDVAQITLHQNGETRQIVRNGPNKWSLAPGSQGIINPPAIEETMHRLGELTAAGWTAQDATNAASYGFKPDNLQITVELKNGTKNTVDFGAEIPAAQTALAAMTLDGERWAFVFPPVLYQFVLSYLAIPANVP
ncbi:MAG: DUF4340 domain-containing protein [Verrucomicrobiota bacterium]|jgi:hypothetical protein